MVGFCMYKYTILLSSPIRGVGLHVYVCTYVHILTRVFARIAVAMGVHTAACVLGRWKQTTIARPTGVIAVRKRL